MKFETEKLRPIHFGLILLVLILYGYLFSGILSENQPENTIAIASSDSDSERIYQAAKLDEHHTDPFRSRRRIVHKKPVIQKVVEKKTEPKIPEIQLPHFTIQGYSDKDGKRQLTISFNNQLFFVRPGEQFADMKLESIDVDVIQVSYRSKLFKKTLPDL
ncbi:MAG: hypothetical protein KDD94_11935 [Calditrichaeota bacterium]|nr:hypothetical protein [Calditrichota bacterium]